MPRKQAPVGFGPSNCCDHSPRTRWVNKVTSCIQSGGDRLPGLHKGTGVHWPPWENVTGKCSASSVNNRREFFLRPENVTVKSAVM